MNQSTIEDDLFDEAAADIRTDVEEHLAAAREALPASEAIWSVEADNTLGVLNSLEQALDTGDAADRLRDAKKWYAMGERADAFDDADDLAEQIEELEAVLEDVEAAHDHADELSSTVPELRGALDEASEAANGADDTDESDDADDADATDGSGEAEEAAE
ncbi:DUF5790 family protein [Halococcus agarilyticus]|uniref:DUF5790 family protein n=1 Tax=Halococcus agarilyticus TaxID=1232219 RepID=UPI000677CA33|nr:DUF5790 family protein [Halococcus agarilyticus]